MKPTTQPQSHLVFANAQPRYVSMCFAPPSGRHLSPGQSPPMGLIRTIPPVQSTCAAPKPRTEVAHMTSERSKAHRANFR
jgi:hypothetical protein